ncbi:organic hydroperoxide resistance protein [Moniliophthora roreri MCA 2997]|uniref:Organic hydroperoxide resistance protein n=2 Tax=Moniliophthora roreri TaxID=221103 RepID=V2XI05_MONRO|nr:organic hydroperoxide resistance protein [Moniliophthora roreri MCA 2997]
MLAARSVLKAGRFTPRSLNYVPSRSLITLKETKYTATATATGEGRNGHVSSNGLDLNLATPKELGGNGNGQNPEQLFAMGYAACLLGAIRAVAAQKGKADVVKDAKVHTSVHIGTPNELPGFGLAVDIKVEGVDDELLKAGHEFCPYSRLAREGAVVKVSKA